MSGTESNEGLVVTVEWNGEEWYSYQHKDANRMAVGLMESKIRESCESYHLLL